MFEWLIAKSIENRLLVVLLSTVLLLYGTVMAVRMPVDVFPDLTAPTVTVLAEAHGLAPEEVEALLLGRVPIGRLIEPEEVAEAAVYVASDPAAAMTGHAMTLSGGLILI